MATAPSSRFVDRVTQRLVDLLAANQPSPPSVNSLGDLIVWATQIGLDRTTVDAAVARELKLNWRSDTQGLEFDGQFVQRIPISFARENGVLGFKDSDGQLLVAVNRFESLRSLDHFRRLFDRPVRPFYVADGAELKRLINQAYENRGSETSSVIKRLAGEAIDVDLDSVKPTIDLLDAAENAPVVNLVNSILFDAVTNRASDVHIQPYEDQLQVRFRIDGMLFDQFSIPKSRQEEIISRIKIIGKMNIAEKRMPQDGRATVRLGDRTIDLRIASLPSSHGERIVVRLLDKSARLYTLGELGMQSSILARFERLIHLEHGIILVTGPTGSGKSTTLYAALQAMNSKDLNIVTLEDPIEYQLDGISQTQINEKKGLTFASGLRSVLRQDPDVIMVGEIRDEDTAKMAIQSALTGHLVFSTLHTNDAASAVTRLLDLGIEPYLVASSVVGVLAQRLVRRICESCRHELDAGQLKAIDGQMVERAFSGKGCKRCRETGYFGRFGVFELMLVTDTLRQAIQSRANASEIRAIALNEDMRLMRVDGIEKVRSGKTTLEEVLRVSQIVEG